MLKNIRLHIEEDEQKQALLDKQLAQHILCTQRKNSNAFQRHIPSLLGLVKSANLTTHSLFCNKYGEFNIVDYGLGRTFYGFYPQQEVNLQVEAFLASAPHIDFTAPPLINEESQQQISGGLKNSPGWLKQQKFGPAPDDINCLVIFGCGLGLHILSLLQNRTIKHLIIYEPVAEYFQCSTLVTQWDQILEVAKIKGTQLYIQTGKDGRDLISDMHELQTRFDITAFYLYQHYNHPVFDKLTDELTTRSWQDIERQGFHFKSSHHYSEYVCPWSPVIDVQSHKDVSRDSSLFEQNLAALRTYFPAIYQEFKDYQPELWLPIINPQGEVNLVKKDSLKPWYGSRPKTESLLSFNEFSKHPHKDGLILGYTGTKLAHYIHYQFVKQTEQLLAEAADEIGTLPKEVPSIILFGIGVGYQLEAMLEQHDVEKLFLCEPNTDFFYASLFAIDWQAIFKKVEKSDARIYFNIGDDGTNLFRDLLNQFHSIGPYILNNTYFYQSYYNAALNTAIAQLREQLQIVISMGEYFDHAYYGIAHTKEGIRRKTPTLIADPASKLTYYEKEVPIFIVGNGPSLDSSIEAIKEWQDRAIVISCGTALQALHRHGITPDFHAEIEQNRSTFDWAVLVGDLEYLKKITLISCNGIHPDTCDLYKDVMVAFKEGESSTVSALSVLGGEHFETLKYAFPTVSNFVTDLMTMIGFRHMYLMGVDLGFVDVNHHHSKSSGYYMEDGKESFDYSQKNNTSLTVPGNFRAKVNTKHEFKISRQMIEQVAANLTKDQIIYNCSDGAKIAGTSPLPVQNLLIVATPEQKSETLSRMRTCVFSNQRLHDFSKKFDDKFQRTLLLDELTSLAQIYTPRLTSKKQTTQIINIQKEMLFRSYSAGNSLLFYYLYGTLNFASAVFTKLSNSIQRQNSTTSPINTAKKAWLKTLEKIHTVVASSDLHFDNANFDRSRRENLLLSRAMQQRSLLVITNSSAFVASLQRLRDKLYHNNFSLTICSSDVDIKQQFDYVLHNVDNSLGQTKQQSKTADAITLLAHSRINSLRILHNTLDLTQVERLSAVNKYSILPLNGESSACKYDDSPASIADVSLRVLIMNEKPDIVLPKYTHTEADLDANAFFNFYDSSRYYAYDLGHYIGLFSQQIKLNQVNLQSGTRPFRLNASNMTNSINANLVEQTVFDQKVARHIVRNPLISNDESFSGSLTYQPGQ